VKVGKLIVFEGADEVGKTTLSQMLAEVLRSKGVTCEIVGFPGTRMGTLGAHIHKLHHDATRFQIGRIDPTSLQLLHVAAHIDAIEHYIRPALSKNRIVILDRFWWSTWVYGVVSHANKNSLKAAIRAETFHWSGIQPSRVFLVTCTKPYERQPDIEKWNQTNRVYRSLAAQEKHKYPVTIIRNDSTPEAALSQIKKHSGLFRDDS